MEGPYGGTLWRDPMEGPYGGTLWRDPIRTDLFQVKKMVPLSDIKTLELFRLQISSLSDRRFCVYIVYHPPRGTKLSGTEN